MKYLPQVTAGKYLQDYVIHTRFDDGTEKSIDISQWFKGPVFEPLKDLKVFKKFFLDSGTIAWPNGVDIAPEALYLSAAVKSDNKKKKA